MAARSIVFALLALTAGHAAERRLEWEDEKAFYRITFDDRDFSEVQMRQIALLSPWLLVRVPGAPVFHQTWRHGAPEDKQLAIAPLEAGGGSVVDDAFLARAAANLKQDREQIRALTRQQLPKVLRPVREYLGEQAKFLLRLEQDRYGYFRSGRTLGMWKRICQVCPCAAAEQAVIDDLKHAPRGGGSRVTDAWYNRVLGCHEALTLKYPMESWRQFLHQYGLVEEWKSKTPLL